MTQRQHTPGPWRVFTAFVDVEIVTDRPTANETESIVQFKGQRNALANAALIVRAVNSHEHLVRACRLLVNAYAKAGDAVDGGSVDWDDIDIALRRGRSRAKHDRLTAKATAPASQAGASFARGSGKTAPIGRRGLSYFPFLFLTARRASGRTVTMPSKPIHRLIKQALQYRFLPPGQLSELQRASAIIEGVADLAKDSGDEFLADDLFDILATLDAVIDDREEARQRYLNENRVPDEL
jgi:hypothetical protein